MVVVHNMKYATKLFCLVVAVTSAKAASISGGVGLDKNAASFTSSIVFPKIPGINAPLSSIFTPRQAPASPASNISPPKPPSPSSVLDLFDIPNPRALIPDLPSAGNSSDVSVPSIPDLPDISSLSQIPGVGPAIQSARNHVQAALNITSDISSGIEQAIAEAFDSNDPTAAVRTIAQTITNAYVTAASNCPLVIVGSRVLQEGIRLLGEVARSAGNVIFGSNSTATA